MAAVAGDRSRPPAGAWADLLRLLVCTDLAFRLKKTAGGAVYRSLGASANSSDDGLCFRSLGTTPPSEFQEAEAVEAALGVGKADGRALKLSVPAPGSKPNTNLAATVYQRFALPFGTVPAEQFLRGVVNSLLSMQAACEAPQDGKKGPKSSDGLVESRHCERAIKCFEPGKKDVDMEDIVSSLKNYNKNAKDLLPKEDLDSDSDDESPLSKAQKLKSDQSPSSPKEEESDED